MVVTGASYYQNGIEAILRVLGALSSGAVLAQGSWSRYKTGVPQPDVPAATRVPDHDLLRVIGRGAYGEVWLARHRTLGTLRAVKVVRRADFEDERPFRREFEGIRRYEPISRSHPNLVPILHVGGDDSAFFYLMELADGVGSRGREDGGRRPDNSGQRSEDRRRGAEGAGRGQKPEVGSDAGEIGGQASEVRNQKIISEHASPPIPNSDFQLPNPADYRPHTLRHRLKTAGPGTADEAIALGCGLAGALAHLHAHGLVHRDVKPSNVIFAGAVPKLADLGLVTDVGDSRSFVGTEGYIPPEGPGSASADCYALGKLLYEFATGRDRHEWPAPAADLATRPDRERLLELNAVLHRACAPRPADRYPDGAAMLADLEHVAEGRSLKRRRTWQQTRRWLLRAGAAAAAVVVLGLAVTRLRPAAPASVFVLPFHEAGTNAVSGELRDRMTDAFINSLKLLPGVTVAPRRSALAQLPEAGARAEAARLFGVHRVLSGTMASTNGLVLTLTLHEPGRARPVWTRTFAGDTNRLIELEEHAIKSLATALRVPVPPGASQQIGLILSNNLAAWRLVGKAKAALRTPRRPMVDETLGWLSEALQLDPDYFEALSEKVRVLRNLVGDIPPQRAWPEIKDCAGRMIQIDRSHGAGPYHLWGALLHYDWDWAAAERTFQERRARDADWPVVTALYLRMVGRFAEARIEQAKLAGLDQSNGAVRYHTAAAAFVERDFPLVLDEADRTDVLLGQPGIASDWRFHGHYHLGQFEQAISAVQVLRKRFDSPICMAMEAAALARAGRAVAARKLLDELEGMRSHRYVDAYPLAWVHLALGDREAALKDLRRACEERSEFVVSPDMPGGLRTDPKLDELRDEPEFQALLKLAGLDLWSIPEWKP